jgi:EmrB/QacA subfamily drug resistance transporter
MKPLLQKARLVRRKESVPEKIYDRRWAILGVLCLSLMVVMIGNTSLNVALPVLSKELNASSSQLQWLVDSYSLVFAGFLFTAGAIGDRFGRKGILQAGLVLFALASAGAAMVNTASALIALRALMGLAGAMIMPATLSILTNVFPAKERARAVGIWAGVSGAGIALGPLLTGYILEHSTWHATFLINVPVILLAIVAGAILIPRTADPAHTNLDLVGAGLSIAGLVSLVYALIEAPGHGWLSPETLLIGGAGLVIMAVFVWWELRKRDHAMLDVRLFKIPAFGVSSLALTLVFFAMMGAFFSFSLLMQLIFGYTPLESAVRMLPIAATMMVVSPFSTKIVESFGKRRTVAAGMLILAVAMFLFSRIGIDASYLQFALTMVLMALGMSIAMTPTTDLLMSAVPRNRAGMGSAMNDTTRELGGALGIAVLGSILASQYSSKIAPAITALPEATRTAASESLAGAMAVGQQIGGATGAGLVRSAQEAWMVGFHTSLLVGSVLIVIAAVIAYFGLPETAADHVVDEIPEEGGYEADEPALVAE